MPGVLAVGAHPDDVELGCGGTLARHVDADDDVTILVMTSGRRDGDYTQDEIREQAMASAQTLGVNLKMLSYPDQRLDSTALLDLTREVEVLLRELEPATVYTHSAGDLNLDHRIVARAVTTACRPLPSSPVETLCAFEAPSSSEWGSGFHPNLYRCIDGDYISRKMDALACYKGEMREYPHPRSPAGILMLARLRGVHVGLSEAEAFEVLRVIA